MLKQDTLKYECATAFCLGFLTVGLVYAQTSDVTVRPDDIIEWVAESGNDHQVRFGGTVGGTTLTPVADIEKYLGNFSTALTKTGDQALAPVPEKSEAPLLSAKVIAGAGDVGKVFLFTCGIHPTRMLSRPFKIEAKVADEPPRRFRLKGVTGQHWILEVPIDTTPPAL